MFATHQRPVPPRVARSCLIPTAFSLLVLRPPVRPQAEILDRIGVSQWARPVVYDAWAQYEADSLLLPSPVRTRRARKRVLPIELLPADVSASAVHGYGVERFATRPAIIVGCLRWAHASP